MTKKIAVQERLLTTKSEENFYCGQLLGCFLRGESATVEFVAGAGRKKTLTYLVENSASFGFEKLGKYKIVYIDFDDLTSSSEEAYFKMILQELGGSVSVKDSILKLLKQNYQIIIILGRFDDLPFSALFFNNLKSIWDLDKKKIHFIFPVNKDIFSQEILAKFGKLKEVIVQNRIYYPLFSLEDSLFSLKRREKKYGYQLTSRQENEILSLSGGHPLLLKICLKQTDKNADLSESLAVKVIMADIWNSLSEDEAGVLKNICLGGVEKDLLPERLVNLGLVKFENNKEVVFSSLFEEYVKKQKIKTGKFSFTPDSGELLFGNYSLREKFSLSEYRLLSILIKNANKVYSRDDIADILWGKESFEKYSDWAIDKVIFFLRRKIKAIGVDSQKIQSIRNRGYRWVE